jgi:DNA repair protein RecN (Recombination protein N)
MINWLDVRNFVLVEHVSLNFGPGMTVLTGETGAGKSIIVDALAILLGDRASGDIVRQGCDRAEIQAGFDLSENQQATEWLDTQLLNDETGECSLRRLIFKSQSSRGFINGRPVPIHSLKELGDLLVDIHSQHEHHLLLRQDSQRVILDAYGDATDLVGRITQIFTRLSNAQSELEELEAAAASVREWEETIRRQVEELTLLDLETEELETLDTTHERLAHAHELAEGTWQTLQTLDELEDTAATTQIHKSSQRLLKLSQYDPRLTRLSTQLEVVESQLTEIVSELRRWQSEYNLDPAKFEAVQDRLAVLHEAARKYRVHPLELRALLDRLEGELESSSKKNTRIEYLVHEIQSLEAQYDEMAEAIHKARTKARKNLAASVTQHLVELGLDQAVFQIDLIPLAKQRRGRYGAESVAFSIRTNPDFEFGPLEKIASGGELSRISLAIQVAASQADSVPSSIYDEVDVGIGGRIAEIVGNKLKALGVQKQILCITHLPQVAVQGNDHLQITKQSGKDTQIHVQDLDLDQRLEEISRMLGGIEITRETRAHAADMLKRAGN